MDQFKGVIRKTFLAGMVVVVPIVITVLALIWLFNVIDGLLSPVFHTAMGVEVPGLGFLSTVVIIFLAGLLATNVLGSRLLKFVQDLMMRVPVVKNIYPAVRQLVETFSPANEASFKKVVLVEYPQKGIFSLGFLTSELTMANTSNSLRLYSVYIPTNNLYLGLVALFKAEDVIITGFTVEEGLKIILSGGAAFPASIKLSQFISSP
jgi:uncharacterized membrane protein